jgi:hypothetical protein
MRTEVLTAAMQPTVYVLATDVKGTRAALETAVPLARGSRARLEVLVPQVVPYPLPIDEPAEPAPFAVERYRRLLDDLRAKATIRMCLCRHADDVIVHTLPRAATVVVGGAAGTWRASRDERLGHRLTRLGHRVVFAPVAEQAAEGRSTETPVTSHGTFDMRSFGYFAVAAVLSLGLTPRAARGQAPENPPAEPAAQAAAAETSPLDGITFGIGLDGYAMWNANHPAGRVNLLRAYDVTSDNFTLNQANVIVERAPDVAKGRRMGLRLDLMFGQATETLQGSASNEPRPQVYRNIFQAYGSYVFPAGNGLQVDFGKFASALGFENNYTKDQINYSRSYFFDYLPFYHVGFRVTYPVNDRLSLTYWLVNGAQQSEDFNGSKSQAAIVTIKPVPSVSWNVNFYAGREGRDVTPALNPGIPALPTQPGLSTDPVANPDRSRLNIFDTYVSWTKGPLLFGAEADYVALAPEDPALASSIVKGGAGYVQYRVSPQVQLGARYTCFGDRAGLFSGQVQNLQDVTATATWQPADGFMLRGEFRNDHSDHSFFLGPTAGDTRANQRTLTLGLVFWFGSKQGGW